MIKSILAILSFVALFIVSGVALYKCKNTRYTKTEFDKDINLVRHQEGKITYLIFGNGNGMSVVNYTQDSLDWEFLHSPTKTMDNAYDQGKTQQTKQSDGTVRTFVYH
jgi:hypothetical protein